MGLLNRIFSSPPRDVNMDTSAVAQVKDDARPKLTMDGPRADRHAWHAELPNALNLLAELKDLEPLPFAGSIEKRIHRGPALPVHPDTLLQRAHLSDPALLTERLHANRLPCGAVVMATPTHAQRKLWLESAKAHQITHVVRLGTDLETMTLDLAGREPGLAALTALTASGHGAPMGLKGPSRFWEVCVKPHAAVPPSVLREVFDKLAAHPPEAGCLVAFQSPGGDDRSAVFGAGWKVYKDLQAKRQAGLPVDDHTVQQAVQDAVLQTHMNRSTQVLQQPEHLATLLAMGMQLCNQPKQPTVRFVAHPRVATLGTETLRQPPDGAALQQARHAAAARALCQDILEMKELVGQSYEPLQGSKAATRRIHPDCVLTPDARLQSLPGEGLLGAWAAHRTLVLERPGPAQALAWATACLTHNISAVVDVSSAAELAQPDAMTNGRQSVQDGTHFNFEWGRSGQVELDHLLPGATATGMQISATLRGEPVTRDVSIDPSYMDEEHRIPTERSLERLQVPLQRGKPVPPKHLLAIAKLMEGYRSDGPGHTVAVQCPGGDVRAAVVAAADALYSRFQAGRLSAETLDGSIRDIWTRLCLDYSIDLAHEPEQLASLMDMGELLMATGKRTQRWQ